MKERQLKKKFLVVGYCGFALIAWLVKAVAGGALYATAAFFTKLGWERWNSGDENRD